jgi:tripartite-type tricarboxylate transporter receptor subunit TctC
MKFPKRLIVNTSAAVIFLGICTVTCAQGYPDKPIRVVVPFPPGGSIDVFARLISQKLAETASWSFVIDNRPGAGGNIGMEIATKAAPDGYTIVMGQTSNISVAPALYPNLPYDPLKNLAPVTLVAASPLLLSVPGASAYKTLGELVAAAKVKPGDITIASPGNGTISHLTIVLFQSAAGVRLTHVPYKGTVQAMTDLVGGRLGGFMGSIQTTAPFIATAKVRPLAVTAPKRAVQLPAVPTFAESGFAGFSASGWWGLLAPRGTPAYVVMRLNREVVKVLKLPDVRERLAADGSEVLTSTPAEFAAFLKSENEKWARVVRDSGARPD